MINWDNIESTWRGHEAFVMWLIERMHPKVIVEIGTYKGYSTHALAKPGIGKVITIDKVDYGQIENLKDFKNVQCIIGDSQEVVKTFTDTVDLLHIDGDHDEWGVQQDLKMWMPKLHPDGVLLLHDILNPGVPHPAMAFDRIKYGNIVDLTLFKRFFLHGCGLGIMTTDLKLVNDIDEKYRSGIIDENNMNYIRWYVAQIIGAFLEAKENGKA